MSFDGFREPTTTMPRPSTTPGIPTASMRFFRLERVLSHRGSTSGLNTDPHATVVVSESPVGGVVGDTVCRENPRAITTAKAATAIAKPIFAIGVGSVCRATGCLPGR